MISINYHHLYYFWTTVKAGSIHSAKKKLLLAQPTLSLQLKELERSLSRRLLDRSHKGVALTPEGRRVFEYCERIFPVGEELASEMGKEPRGAPPILHIGIQDTVPRAIVLRMLDHLERAARGLRIFVFGGGLQDLEERLARHMLDVLITDVDLSRSLGRDFIGRMKARVPVVFVGTPALLRGFKRFPRDLSSLPLLMRAPGNPVRKEVDRFLLRHGIDVSIAAEIEDAHLVRQLALRGRGVALLNRLSVKDDLRAGRLVQLHQRPIGIIEPVWFATGKHPNPITVLQAAVQTLLDDFQVE
ncbi:MAG TPA: hypothetical protein DCM05_08220 [Elusimicrobia bacterium]|nr:hypothetical protein [Elusimicrobiota bacterium]